MYSEVNGDLIQMTLDMKFDVIAHGCNCFCSQKSGIAPLIDAKFNTAKPHVFTLEDPSTKGDINKLGQIQYKKWEIARGSQWEHYTYIVNCYTQYYNKTIWNLKFPDTPKSKFVDYNALAICLAKINHIFQGKHIGLPKIGCGLGGGNWDLVSQIIKMRLKDCKVTVVIKE